MEAYRKVLNLLSLCIKSSVFPNWEVIGTEIKAKGRRISFTYLHPYKSLYMISGSFSIIKHCLYKYRWHSWSPVFEQELVLLGRGGGCLTGRFEPIREGCRRWSFHLLHNSFLLSLSLSLLFFRLFPFSPFIGLLAPPPPPCPHEATCTSEVVLSVGCVQQSLNQWG